MTIAAVVLAAGAGSRFAGPGHKLRVPLEGSTVLGRSVAAAIEAGLDETIVVAGAEDLTDLVPPGVTLVEHERWSEGIAVSLQVGIDTARRHGHEAVVVGLGDQPGVRPAAWRAVAAAVTPIAVATYGGRRRNPVRLASEVWPLLPVTGDEGARALMRVRPELVGEIPCEGRPGDIDTLEDLERWS